MPESCEKRYEGFGWITSGRHRDDPSLPWEERYRILEEHRVKETTFLIEEVRRLAKEIDALRASS